MYELIISISYWYNSGVGELRRDDFDALDMRHRIRKEALRIFAGA